ncbi:MAG TPA: hypothetical protein VFM97_00155 [Gammaproteobacteria bacterium]|nr:hypothetical protein [Gammaproteobacteria bacterium]
MHRLLLWITRNMPARVIKSDSLPYLLRYYVGQFLGRTWYLHQYLSPDAERHVHNHPHQGTTFSIVCRGRYLEERLVRLCPQHGLVTQKRLVRWVNILRPRDFHRILRPQPNTWTLFAFKRSDVHGWGFLRWRDQQVTYSNPLRGYARGGDHWWLKPETVPGWKLRARFDIR